MEGITSLSTAELRAEGDPLPAMLARGFVDKEATVRAVLTQRFEDKTVSVAAAKLATGSRRARIVMGG